MKLTAFKPDIYELNLFFLAILACMAVWGGIIYKIRSLDVTGVALALTLSLITIITVFVIKRRFSVTAEIFHSEDTSKYHRLLLAAYGLLFIGAVYVLVAHATDRAIVSPWQVIPNYFFVLYFLSSLIIGILAAGRTRLSIFPVCLHYLLSLSVISIIYRLGFGYDSFVHLATLDLIDKQGAVEPRTFYYLGQYGLFIILHKLTLVPIFWLNRLFIPLLAGLSLPLVLLRTFRRWVGEDMTLVAILPLIIPSAIFTFTTPQNFGYFFLILAVYLGLTCSTIYDLVLIYLFSGAALLIQPLAGLPAIIFALLLTIYHIDGWRERRKNISYVLISIFSIALLPVLFYFFDGAKPISWTNLAANLRAVAPSIPGLAGSENVYLNAAYLYGINLNILLALSVISGIAIYRRLKGGFGFMKIHLLMGASMLAAAAFTLVLPFSFLIEYERGDYAERIAIEALIFLSPFVMLSLAWIAKAVVKHGLIEKSIWLIFFAGLATAALYLEYPRIDNYFNSRGYSTGAADVRAVEWINSDANGDYIVLSDQQVSAAALSRFGFFKYYRGNLFYYPIPTSSPLYRFYLDMVYKKPEKTTMIGAMDLAGVDKGYFVLNKYWWAFPKILDEAKFAADSWQNFGDGQVYVFKFKR